MTILFRAQFLLMAFNKYAYGDHVKDPAAFVLRAQKLLKERSYFRYTSDL